MPDGQDAVAASIGDIGRWQVRQAVILSMVGVVCGWHVAVISFLAPPTDHWCAPPNPAWDPIIWKQRGLPTVTAEDGTSRLSQCRSYVANSSAPAVELIDTNATVACSRWHYDKSKYKSNVIIEWDLVCSYKWLQMLAQGIFMIGLMFGALTWGVVADRFGRRPGLLVCVLLSLVSSSTTAASCSVTMFLVCRFLEAYFGIGAYSIAFVICMELVGESWRALLGICFCLPMSFGLISLGGMAYLLRDWRMLQLAVSLPGVFLLSYYWLVPESPRWLLSKGRMAEAREILQTICSYNQMELPPDVHTEKETSHNKEQQPSESFLDMLRNRRMIVILATMFVCWFVNSLTYYSFLLNIGDFIGNIYLNSVLGGAVEVPAYAVCAWAIYRWGRRLPISTTMVVSGAATLLTLFFDKGEYTLDWPIASLAMLGKLCITGSYGTIYIYTTELFPTSVRNTGLATCSVGSRFGGILAPFLVLLRDVTHPAVPVVLFGSLSIASGVSILVLPETAKKPLPEVISDVTSTSHRNSGRTCEKAEPLRTYNGSTL